MLIVCRLCGVSFMVRLCVSCSSVVFDVGYSVWLVVLNLLLMLLRLMIMLLCCRCGVVFCVRIVVDMRLMLSRCDYCLCVDVRFVLL